ncbi:MAG: putative transport system substrate-binding protein [Bradyrhizobium sp.]|nr:putative transport system substrate-binding protein [Bradyrhizobium sp.]
MKRREFIKLCGGTALTWPVMARAQQMPTIGLLGTATAQAWARLTAAFHQGLGEAGYTEGRNVAIEYRWAGGQYERLAQMANDLVRHPVSALVAFTTPAALAAKAATTTTPIVFTTISDPVQSGLVTSLSRPDGNMTGTTYLNVELGPKLLELMRETTPTATSMVLLINPTNPTAETQRAVSLAAARTLGIELHVMRASNPGELDAAFENLAKLRTGGLVLGGDPFFNSQFEQIAALALRNRLPSIYSAESYPAAGGLMSYGGNASEAYKQAGIYTGRILRGEKLANLPVQQVTKVELVINLKIAKALGISLPLALLGRADEIIE